MENPEEDAADQRRMRQSGRYQEAYRRRWYLNRQYGITQQEYEARLVAQGAGCAICADPPGDGQTLHVDHDHLSGALRGLLCFRCNAAIGNLRDDPDLLARAAAYLAAGRKLIAPT